MACTFELVGCYRVGPGFPQAEEPWAAEAAWGKATRVGGDAEAQGSSPCLRGAGRGRAGSRRP